MADLLHARDEKRLVRAAGILRIVTNYLNGNNDVYVAPEVGLSRKGTTPCAKAGIGFIDPELGDRDWGVEFGARVTF